MPPETIDASVSCPHCGKPVPGAQLTFHAIAVREAVAVFEATGVPIAALMSGRGRKVARARWALWQRLSDLGWTNSRIARVCGRVDASTVLYALRQIEVERRQRDAA